MNNKLLMVVMIPFVVLCLLIVRAEYHLSMGAQWDFALTGYDPRDLLRGHYLRFRLDYDWQESRGKCNDKEKCFYCLTDVGNQAPKVRLVSGHVVKQCDGYMQFDNPQEPLNRFYIPETKAVLAESLLRQARLDSTAYLRISINEEGLPQIIDLFIDGEPLSQLLKKALEE